MCMRVRSKNKNEKGLTHETPKGESVPRFPLFLHLSTCCCVSQEYTHTRDDPFFYKLSSDLLTCPLTVKAGCRRSCTGSGVVP